VTLLLEHPGTRTHYVKGCRCDACTKANTDYMRHRRATRIKLPVEPLLDMFVGVNEDEIAHRLGVTRHTIEHWKNFGLSLTVGDRVAVRLGLHPLLIWKDDYWKADL
jgi:hypothetical protein